MIEVIALWWCYVTGGALALALAMIAWWFAIETALRVTGNTKKVAQWYWDRCKGGGEIITQKSSDARR